MMPLPRDFEQRIRAALEQERYAQQNPEATLTGIPSGVDMSGPGSIADALAQFLFSPEGGLADIGRTVMNPEQWLTPQNISEFGMEAIPTGGFATGSRRFGNAAVSGDVPTAMAELLGTFASLAGAGSIKNVARKAGTKVGNIATGIAEDLSMGGIRQILPEGAEKISQKSPFWDMAGKVGTGEDVYPEGAFQMRRGRALWAPRPTLPEKMLYGEYVPGMDKNWYKAGREKLMKASKLDPNTPRELPWELGLVSEKNNPYHNPELRVVAPDPATAERIYNTPLSSVEDGESFIDRLTDPRSREIFEWHNSTAGKNQSAIHGNAKTGFSVDFSTTCANKCSGKGPCVYCYVDQPESQRKAFNKGLARNAMMSRKKYVEHPYRGEILTWPDELIEAINMDNGLRMFSAGDYRTVDYENVARLLDDASLRGLKIKAITKNTELVHTFADHPNMFINLSTDSVPLEASHGVQLDEAVKLRRMYPGKIKVRSVALNEKEAIEQLENTADIDTVTFYHGTTNFDADGNYTGDLTQTVLMQNPGVVQAFGGMDNLVAYLDTWDNIGGRQTFIDEMVKKYGNRVCCQGGKCALDRTKCGWGNRAIGALFAGVTIPTLWDAWDDEND